MSHKKNSDETFVSLLSDVIGELVWFVRLGADSVLRMDFGSPHLKIAEPVAHLPDASRAATDALQRRLVIPTGKWHLFIDEGAWSVKTSNYTCTKFDADTMNINATLRQLDGQRVTNVRRDFNNNGMQLDFDLGGILNLEVPRLSIEIENPEGFLWTVFREDGSYASQLVSGGIMFKPHRTP